MAGSSLLTLLDDIASVLDDVAVLTKVATKKTAGVLGDDLALNAQQVSGVTANRELPVVWAVAKGSAVNKVILVPAALAISALAPWGVTPLLMAGGTFLCYEGFEKVVHKLRHADAEAARREDLAVALADPVVDLVAFEKDKIRGAIRTDFILSAEIVVITLGTVADAAFGTRVAVLAGIAVLMTVGVYGLVAGIVKLDDAGLYLSLKGRSAWVRSIGRAILRMAPWLMKGLAIAGTAAMFLVGGSIIQHGIPALDKLGGIVAAWASALPGVGPAAGVLAPLLVNATVGIAAGALALGAVTVLGRLRPAKPGPGPDQPTG
jgi:predicted DNA repair protein MutK